MCTEYLQYSHREGRRGGERWTREKVRGANSSQSRVEKYQHDWLYLQSENSDKTPAAKSLYRSMLLDDEILLWCLFSLLVNGAPLHGNILISELQLFLKSFQLLLVDWREKKAFKLRSISVATCRSVYRLCEGMLWRIDKKHVKSFILNKNKNISELIHNMLDIYVHVFKRK